MRLLLATSYSPLAHLVRRSFRRWRYEWVEVDNGFDAFQKAAGRKFDLVLLDFDLARMKAPEVLERLHAFEGFHAPPVIVFVLSDMERKQIEAKRFPQTHVFLRPFVIRQFISKVHQLLKQDVEVVCVGGGTGLFTLLSGLKTLAGIRICSVVSMSDDGGSTGKLRDLFGILPPGDIRRSLVALSTAPGLLNELMQYRFKKGGELRGHNLGNLLLTALAEMHGSMSSAVHSLAEILNIQGLVIPVTETVNTLKAELEDGSILEGEHRIDLFEGFDPPRRIKRLWQVPPVKANPDALQALARADFLLLGPGDLFTSLISNLIVQGVSKTVVASRAKKIYICNIMTKTSETPGFEVSDHVREIVKYLKKDSLDYVLASSTTFSESALRGYARKKQSPVVETHPSRLAQVTRAEILWADVASERELVRHDSLKLASEVQKIIEWEAGK